jgi:hypothetical protein
MGCLSHRRRDVEVRPEQKWDYIVSSSWDEARLNVVADKRLPSEPPGLQVDQLLYSFGIRLSLHVTPFIPSRLQRRYLHCRSASRVR